MSPLRRFLFLVHIGLWSLIFYPFATLTVLCCENLLNNYTFFAIFKQILWLKNINSFLLTKLACVIFISWPTNENLNYCFSLTAYMLYTFLVLIITLI